MPYTREQRREVQRRSRVKMRGMAIDALGGCCIECGIADHRVLEFDHVTPIQWRTNGKVKMNGQQNTNTINAMVKTGEDPAAVYQLLCANCHKIKTADNQDYEFRGN
jgi:5-methylcytosine-specific restriction endonuclease McrA